MEVKTKNVVYIVPTSKLGSDIGGRAIALVAGKWVGLGGHVSSNWDWLKSDLQRDYHQEAYKTAFPAGYAIECVERPDLHPVLCEVFGPREEANAS